MDIGQPDFQLFQREGTSNWSMRFTIAGQGQIRKSLGTPDRAIAEKLALQVWYEAHIRVRSGLTAKVRSFEQVAEEYIGHIITQSQRGERAKSDGEKFPAIIRRYFIGYFGQKPFDTIRESDVTRYLEWRKGYWLTGPGKDLSHIEYVRNGKRLRRPVAKVVPSLSRQRGEAVLLRALFRQAAKWGYWKATQIPEVSVPKVTASARPSFTFSEYCRLHELAVQRTTDLGISDYLKRDRAILLAYINLAAHTGMRPTEIKNLNWGDVLHYREVRDKPSTEREKVRIRVHGKGKSRTFIPFEEANYYLDWLWDFWLKDHDQKPPGDRDPVFVGRDGKRLESPKKGLTELLKAADLLFDYRGVRRSAYSFRHYYISQQLMHDVDIFLLAQNTGTSVEMIQKFYADVKLEAMKDKLRPVWTK